MPAPTPYPDVNAALARLLTEVQAILGPRFVGLYLYGSLATGDFHKSSDIDFLVVTGGELPADLLPALEAMHWSLAHSGLRMAKKLEGSYLPPEFVRRHITGSPRYPRTEDSGHFGLTPHDSDWIIQRYVLRECGIVVAGPPVRPMVDPIGPDDLRAAVRATLQEWWLTMLRDPEPLTWPGYQAYAVLTMCRMLYTLEHGAIISKPAAASWAQETLPLEWHNLIRRALLRRGAEKVTDLPRTLDFIRYAAGR